MTRHIKHHGFAAAFCVGLFAVAAIFFAFGVHDAGGLGLVTATAGLAAADEALMDVIKGNHAAVLNLVKEGGGKLEEVTARLMAVEQAVTAKRTPNEGQAVQSWGRSLIDSADFKALATSSSQRGKAAVRVSNTMTSAGGSGGAMIAPDVRMDPVMLPQRRPTVRSLLAPGQTAGNTIYYPRQTVRTNNAAVVTEGQLKPESDIEFEQKQAAVATIATWVIGSRQLLDDAPAMMSTVDNELRYMLDFTEEQELLFGDGTGAHLFGLVPQGTTFDSQFAVVGENRADIIINAIAQAEAALLPATGIVLNTLDWLSMLAMKDSQLRYLSSGPFGPAQSRLLWDLPVAPTLAMPRNQFVVGSLAIAAQIFDRMEAEVMVSTEDSDNFRKNLITIRAEKRLALAVKRPQAVIVGDFTTAT
jgi:HK97 family phage major capsid protein